MPSWLNDAVFYEIYPQSFYDSNGDGIGDLQGIIEKLDYIKDLGANALWINPCFDSPFKDAGYDVRNYKLIAPRYGTNDDAVHLFEEAHKKGIHVLFDLVPGHTSEEHEWFVASKKAEPNEYSGRYIWTSHAFEGIGGHPYIGGESERSGCYMLNFFKSQPALNYGWYSPTEKWQSATDSPEAKATVEAIKDIMRFWLGLGCDGFRVDMADSLVKDDTDDKAGTSAIWRDIRAMLDREYPDAAMVSEWSNPVLSLKAGFHMDFLLDHDRHGYKALCRDWENADAEYFREHDIEEGRKAAASRRGSFEPLPGERADKSYFKKDAHTDISFFLSEYLYCYTQTKDRGYISLISGNHDTARISYGLDESELRLFFAWQLTMPGVPFIYYGDEVGMRYLADLPTKEGGYQRTGSRTPMQWTSDVSKNCGFSTAAADKLYLPVDTECGLSGDGNANASAAGVLQQFSTGRDVADQKGIDSSLLSTIKALTALRHRYVDDLGADGAFTPVYSKEGSPLFVYRRGSLLIVLNPSDTEISVQMETPLTDIAGQAVYSLGDVFLAGQGLTAGPQSFAVIM